MAKSTDADIRARLVDLADKIEALVRLLPAKGITRADVYAMEQAVKAEREAKRG